MTHGAHDPVAESAAREAVASTNPPPRGRWRDVAMALITLTLVAIVLFIIFGVKHLSRTANDAEAQASTARQQASALAGQLIDHGIQPTITPVPGASGQRGPEGPGGLPGNGITSATIRNGDLFLVFSQTGTTDVGHVVGRNGKNGRHGARGASGSPGPSGQPGAQGQTGEPGRSVLEADVTEEGHLELTFLNPDGTQQKQDVGVVTGPRGTAGRSVTSVQISQDGHLLVTYDDGTTQDAGEVPSGPACPGGYSVQQETVVNGSPPPPTINVAVCVQDTPTPTPAPTT